MRLKLQTVHISHVSVTWSTRAGRRRSLKLSLPQALPPKALQLSSPSGAGRRRLKQASLWLALA